MIKNYNSYINEMAIINKIKNKLFIDNIPLKDIQLQSLEDNILYYKEEVGNFIIPKNFTMVWILDNDKFKLPFIKGEENLLFFKSRISYASIGSPISDIWLKNTPNQKHIIGVIRAITNEDLIYIDMMSVRPGYKRNKINYHMINYLININPNAKLKFSSPTNDGLSFIKKYFPNSEIDFKS